MRRMYLASLRGEAAGQWQYAGRSEARFAGAGHVMGRTKSGDVEPTR